MGLECRALHSLHSKLSRCLVTKISSWYGKLVSGQNVLGDELVWGENCFGAFLYRGLMDLGLLSGGCLRETFDRIPSCTNEKA